MKTTKIANWLANVTYKENNEQIKISFHPLPMGTIFVIAHILPIMLFYLFFIPIIVLLVPFFLFIWIGITSWTSTYQIIIDVEQIRIKQRYFGIPIRSIKADIATVIIDSQSFNDIKCISQRKDWYKHDVINNLRFSFIAPWDSDEDELFINYKNKEITFVSWGEGDYIVWQYLRKGLQRIDELQALKHNDKIY